MSKRSHPDTLDYGSDTASPVSKRAKGGGDSSDALQLILEKAEKLISCIRELQSAKSKQKDPSALKFEDLEESNKKILSTLSQNLLPALQELAIPAQKGSDENKDPPAMVIPSVGMVTKWTGPAIDRRWEPPLPQILDPELETAALTHSGMTTKSSDLSYERLEWIGDAYLYIIASSLVYQTFPRMDPGKCSQAREILIRNSTLAKYSVRYGLHKRANFPAEFGLGGRAGGTAASDKQKVKARGDIFESYVGAIILSDPEHGIQRAADWLKALWGPELLKEVRKEEGNPQILPNEIAPKTELERAIGAKGVRIEYRDMPNAKKDKKTNLPMFTVGCYLHGWGEVDKQLGFGCALGKKEAGQKAAQMALDNTKMLKVYRDKKIAWLRARDAQASVPENQ